MDDLNEAERRETLIDTFASWALEGMHPTRSDIEEGQAYIEGRLTLEEIRARALEECHG